MKYKIKNFFKRSTSLTLALVMVLSGVLMHVGTIALAATTEYQQTDEVLYNEDYSDAKTVADRNSGFATISNDLYPYLDGENKLLRYQHRNHGVGVVQLGFDYSGTTLTDYIAPKQNITYKVEFEYKFADYFAADKTEANADLELGVAVGNKDISAANNNNYQTYTDYLAEPHTTASKVFATVPKASITPTSVKASYEGEWISQCYEFTVPADCDVTDKTLQLFVLGAQRAAVLIDNVKVTALAGVKVTYDIEGKEPITKFYADGKIPTTLPSGVEATNAAGNNLTFYKDQEYKTEFVIEDYKRTGDYSEITLYGRYEAFRYDKDTILDDEKYDSAMDAENRNSGFATISNDLFPDVVDGNHVLRYKHASHGLGVVQLGFDYSKTTLDSFIEPIAGVTYRVDFQYKLVNTFTGTQNAANTDLEMGIAVGNKDIADANNNKWTNNSVNPPKTFEDYLSDTHTSANKVFYTVSKTDITPDSIADTYGKDWINQSYEFTVPADCNVTDKTLQLFVLGAQRVTVLIDNVKVTALAGVNVTYDVAGKEPVTKFYPDGRIPATAPTDFDEVDAAGNVLTFYQDKEYKTKFETETHGGRTGVYRTATLYGKYVAVTYDADTVLSDETYDNALNVDNRNSGFATLSNDLFPTVVEGNHVMKYKQSNHGVGVIHLGFDYSKKTLDENYIKPSPGVTYRVEFQYKITDISLNGAPSAANADLELGIAVGNKDIKDANNNDRTDNTQNPPITYKDYLSDTYTSARQVFTKVAKADVAVSSDWISQTYIFTVPKDCNVTDKTLQLFILGAQRATVLIDNVKVTALAERNYTVKFNTNGGNKIADMQVGLDGLNDLPQATRSNAVFMGWYLDAALSNPFSMEKCLDLAGTVTVYAKWHVYSNGAVITVDDTAFWRNTAGDLVTRLSKAFDVAKENNNNVLKYKVRYAASREARVENRGDYAFESDTYPQNITLFNPDLTVTGDFDYLDVASRAEVGKTYKVSFRYKVVSVDTENSDKGIGFSVYTGNIRNGTAKRVVQSNRFIVENTTTEWKTGVTYFTVKEIGENLVDNGTSYYSDALQLTLSGYGEVLVDDISVTDWDKVEATYIEFATKGGEAIPAQEYVIDANTVLPKAVRKGYTFEGWYTDVKCTKKFNPATYKRTSGMLVLYAGYQGMQGVTEIDFEDYSYYLNASGAKSSTRIAKACTPYTEGNNTAVKFSLKYSTTKVEEWGQCQGEYGTYGAAIGLHDPSVYAAKNATYEDAALQVKKGEKYWISFQYKALSVDTESTYPSAITFAAGVTKENSLGGRQIINKDINPITAKTDGWKTASTYVTIPELTAEGDRLTLFIMGYGEVLIDNIKIIKLTDAVVFDTDGGTIIEPLRGSAGQMVTLPANPERKDSKFVGWYTDANCTQEYSVAKMEKGVKILYAKFLTYQTIQSFEDYSVGVSNRFETDYWLNKLTKDTKETANKRWLGSKFDAEQVRNGKVSVLRKGENQYSRFVGLFYMNTPLTVGEEYELSVWVKITDYFLPGDIQIVHSDKLDNIREEAYWKEKDRGPRYETIANTELMSEYLGEWLEIKYTFTAKSKYIGLATPGITKMYIDDACITLTSADESYARSIEGSGIKYEDWYSEDGKKNVVEEEEDFILMTMSSDMNGSIVKLIVSIAAAVTVLAAAGISSFVLIKKKKRGEVKQ